MTTRPASQDDPIHTPGPLPLGGVSGRRTVLALVVAILVIWFGLDRGFRVWKARYEALARFGATTVAPAIDPLARVVPPDVDPEAWRRAVADTHAMLVALTGAGVLEEAQMENLRREVRERVERSRPETAREELTALWNDLEDRAGPILAPDRVPPSPGSRLARRHPRPSRPALLGPSFRPDKP